MKSQVSEIIRMNHFDIIIVHKKWTHMSRVIFIGSHNVGKTSILSRIVSGTFDGTTEPTMATAFSSYKPDPDDDFVIQFWDTAGTERYRSINRIYYREASGALLTFDYSSKKSFDDLEMWLNDFLQGGSLNDAVILLVGNKCDLKDEFEVSQDDVENWANEKGFHFFSVSAKTGEGIQAMLSYLSSSLPRKATVKTDYIINDVVEEKKCC